MIGDKLKELRKESGQTLHDIAEKSGLSTAYLSNVERNQTSPTINNLFKICKVLDVDITAILSKTPTFKTVVRKDDRKELFDFNFNSKVKYELTTEGTESIRGVCITISADFYDEVVSMGHERDELGVVTSGSMAMYLNDQEYVLEEGDSIFIASGTPHRYKKISGGTCISYWCFTVPFDTPDLQ